MKLNYTSTLNNNGSDVAISLVPLTLENIRNNPPKKQSHYLSLKVIRKMINRLFAMNMTPEKIALALDTTIEELKLLSSRKNVATDLIAKINLPLIKLYCATNFSGNGNSLLGRGSHFRI